MEKIKKISLTKLKKTKLNQNIFIFFFFLVLSVIFWFLNALNKEYDANISIPIEYINLPKDKMTFGKIQTTLSVKATAYGYAFLDYEISAKNPVVIDLNIHKVRKVQSSTKRYYINTNTLKSDITNIIGKDIEIKKINQDSLIFSFEEIIRKKVVIESRINLKLEKQYVLMDSIKFFPDSIFIKGLKSNLDTINKIFTVYKEVSNVNDSIRFRTKLQKINNVEFQTNHIMCTAVAEEFTEMEFELPIEIINFHKNTTIKLFPSVVKVAFNVGFSDYDKILSSQFKFSIDFSEIDINNDEKLSVKLVKSPKEVYLVRYYPKKVDYIVEKND